MTRFTITGRLVQGDPAKSFAKIDRRTKQPRLGQDGQPIKQFFVAIAVPKNEANRFIIPGNPTFEETRALLDAAARASWPQFFGQRNPNIQYPPTLAPDCTNPKFANKIVDGDGFDENGHPNSAKEGWAGCWIIKCSSGFAPKIYEWTSSGWQETLHTGRIIKCGDYVSVSGTCVTNDSTDSPGMYMNFDTVSFEEEGPFIASASTVDPNAALGSRGTPPSQGQGGVPTQPVDASVVSTGAPVHGSAGSTTAPGYSGYRDSGAEVPPPPVTETPPAPPASPQMTAAATTTYEAYKGAGWTDEQLRANGLMV